MQKTADFKTVPFDDGNGKHYATLTCILAKYFSDCDQTQTSSTSVLNSVKPERTTTSGTQESKGNKSLKRPSVKNFLLT